MKIYSRSLVAYGSPVNTLGGPILRYTRGPQSASVLKCGATQGLRGCYSADCEGTTGVSDTFSRLLSLLRAPPPP